MISFNNKIIKSIFIIIFLSLFLGTGSAFYWVSAAFIAVFFLLFFKHLEWKKFSIKRLDFIAWFILIISSLVSLLSTRSVPASFEEVSFYIVAFIFYWLVSLFPKRLFSIKDYVDVILVSTIIISIISFINYFFILQSFEPKVSLTNYYYGHNHLAAILILVLPIIWHYLFFKNKQIYKILAVFIFISLIFSFGRTAIVIGTFQFIYLYTNYKNELSKKIKYILFFIIFSVSLFFLIFFGLFNKIFPDYCRSGSEFRTIVCKDIQSEPRLFYWQQAIYGFKDNLFLGSGLGTFYITNEKYKKDFSLKTFYVHNDYLQHFSETGIIGGFAFLLFLFLLFLRLIKIKKDQVLLKFMIIGLIGILINNFFDFDFNIRPVFILTMSYFAIIRREIKELYKSNYDNKLFKNLLILLCVLILIISGLYFYNIFLLNKRNTSYQKILPIFNSQKKLYFKKNSFDFLYPYFKNDAELYKNFIGHENDNKKKLFMSEQIVDLSPLSTIDFLDFQLYKSQNRLEKFGTNAINSYNSIVISEEITGNYHFLAKRKLMNNLIEVANYEFKIGNYALAGKYYVPVLKMQKWVLHFNNSILLTINEEDLPGIGGFFHEINLDPQYLGQNHDFIQNSLFKIVDNFVRHNPKTLISEDIEHIIPIVEWRTPDLWMTISKFYYEKIQVLVQEGLINEAQELVIIWYKYFRVFDKFSHEYEFNPNIEKVLVSTLVKVLDDNMTFQMMTDFEQMIVYLNSEYFKYKGHELIVFYQLLADEYFQLDNRDSGINALKKMQEIASGSNYWVQAQLGNYYLSIGKKDLAQQEFEKCLEFNDNNHTDCEFGILSIEKNLDRSYRYSQTSKIILGRKDPDNF